MERQIKYRAWDGEHMVSPDYITRDGKAHWTENSIPSTSRVVMQFTGLTDKNGVEIYESDIMQHDNPFDMPFVVNWDKDEAGFVFNNGNTSYVIGDNSFTVIGNIHQHAYLLNDK